jgi:hypothetical protein
LTKGSATAGGGKKRGKGKGESKQITVDSDSNDDDHEEEEDDIVVVKGSTPKKQKRSKGLPKGKKKKVESIDLTTSSPSPKKPTSTSSFAPLSDVYRQERERRRLLNEGIEPRWPTAEEHGRNDGDHLASSFASPARLAAITVDDRRRYPRASQETVKGKERQVDQTGGGNERDSFLAEYYESILSSPADPPFPTVSNPLPIASTSSLLPRDYPSHPLLNRLANSLASKSNRNENGNQSSELWTTKYGPKKAEEVLGVVSGQSALVLKEWLKELKVAGSNSFEGTTAFSLCP